MSLIKCIKGLGATRINDENLKICRSMFHETNMMDVSKQWYEAARDSHNKTTEDQLKFNKIMFILLNGYEGDYKSLDLNLYAMYTVMFGKDDKGKKVIRFNLDDLKDMPLIQKGHDIMILKPYSVDGEDYKTVRFSMSSYDRNRYVVNFFVDRDTLAVVVEKKSFVPEWGNLFYERFIWTG